MSRVVAADAAMLAREAPYSMDSQMAAWFREYNVAPADKRIVRMVELSRRLVARAEALGWPPHSLALANLRLQVALAAHDARCSPEMLTSNTPYEDVSAGEEQQRLLCCATDTLLARLDAGTLLRCTPSETRFNEQRTATEHAPLFACTEPGSEMWHMLHPLPHELGYVTACSAAVAHFYNMLRTLMRASRVRTEGAMVDAHLRTIGRVLDLVATVRAGCSAITAHTRVFQGVQLSRRMYDAERGLMQALSASATPNSRLAAALTSVRNLPADTWPELLASWGRLTAAFGADFVRGAAESATRIGAKAVARMETALAEWTPRPCARCGAREAEPRQWKMCGRCCGPVYCSKACQAAHWKGGHKKECRDKEE